MGKQVKALVAALNKEAERKGGNVFSVQVCAASCSVVSSIVVDVVRVC
jgi:hypothetical protein